jgi:hypothetical protein
MEPSGKEGIIAIRVKILASREEIRVVFRPDPL